MRAMMDITSSECAVVIMRKRHNKLKKTVYKEVLRAMTRLKMPKSEFKITSTPMQITYLKNGSTIYFAGNDNIDDTKGIIDENYPIKRVMIDEVSEFFDFGEGEDEIDQIEATFVRGNDDMFIMEMYFNPPKNKNAPVMKWLEKQNKRTDTIHIHTDYMDVPVKWLGNSLINIANQMKEIDYDQYRWVWLGESVGVSDLIFYMFDEDKHVKEPPQGETLSTYTIGIDYGQLNATTFQCFAIDNERGKVVGIDEYYHSGRDSIDISDIDKNPITEYDRWKQKVDLDCGKQKTPSDYALDFKMFTEHIEEEYNCKVETVVIDPSARGLAEEIKRIMPNLRFFSNKDAGVKINFVKLGLSRVQKLFRYDILEISPKQKHVIKELGLYQYEEKSIERGEEKPLKENDHTMDSLRYVIMALWRTYIKKHLPKGDREDED